MNRGDVHLCQGKNGERLRRDNALGLLAILLLAVLLTACTQTDPTSTEPTDYLISSGEHKVSYLTDDHPDVKEVTELVAQFLAIDQAQNYVEPTYNQLWGLVSQNLLERYKDWETGTLKEYSICKQLLDYKIDNIIFTGNRLRPSRAIVTVSFRVIYTNATTDYAERNGITLNKPIERSASIDLVNGETVRVIPDPLRPQLNPYGWYISHVQYYILP